MHSCPKAFVPTDPREALGQKVGRQIYLLPSQLRRLGPGKPIYAAQQVNALTERPRFEACRVPWWLHLLFPCVEWNGTMDGADGGEFTQQQECACRYCLGASLRMHPFCAITRADPERRIKLTGGGRRCGRAGPRANTRQTVPSVWVSRKWFHADASFFIPYSRSHDELPKKSIRRTSSRCMFGVAMEA